MRLRLVTGDPTKVAAPRGGPGKGWRGGPRRKVYGLRKLMGVEVAESYEATRGPIALSVEGLAVWAEPARGDVFSLSEGRGEDRRSTVIWIRGRASQARLTCLWNTSFCPLSRGFLDIEHVSMPAYGESTRGYQCWRPSPKQIAKLAALELSRKEKRWGKPDAKIRCINRVIESREVNP